MSKTRHPCQSKYRYFSTTTSTFIFFDNFVLHKNVFFIVLNVQGQFRKVHGLSYVR